MVVLCLISGLAISQAQSSDSPTQRSTAYHPPADYYAGTEGMEGDELKAGLHQIIKDHVGFPYSSSNIDTWDILKEADRDPNNPSNVVLIYSGTSVNGAQEYNGGDGWNREHVWPRSLGGFTTTIGPGTDAHNLRACHRRINSRRSNLEFDNGGDVVTTEEIADTYADGDSFEPADSFKGDVARIIFYMAVRYEGYEDEMDLELEDVTDGGVYTFGKLSTLLEWHELDPVDDFERRRNQVVFAYQGNRNPFIDNPEFADKVFGSGGLSLEEIYQQWAENYGLDPLTSGAPTADADDDGRDNWNEFAFATSPVSGSDQPLQSSVEDNLLVLRFLALDHRISYTIEKSLGLRTTFTAEPALVAVPSEDTEGSPPGYHYREFSVPLEGSAFYLVTATAE